MQMSSVRRRRKKHVQFCEKNTVLLECKKLVKDKLWYIKVDCLLKD